MNYEAEKLNSYVNDDGEYTELYSYRGHEYKVYPDNEMPLLMQHQFEQQGIDIVVDEGEGFWYSEN